MADLPSNDEHHRGTSLMSLPPDILDKIFEKVVAGRGGSFKRLKYFSHVCRATREYTENNFAQFQLERMALAIRKPAPFSERMFLALRNSSPTNIVERYLNRYLAAGGDIDAPVDNDGTLLHIAAWENAYDICRLLIEKNPNVNLQNEYGDTPLHIAAFFGQSDICALLVEKNADVDQRNKSRETPLHCAAAQALRALQGGRNEPGASAQNGYHNICKLLVEKNADVNQVDYMGSTTLHIAAKKGYKDVIKTLLNGGADTSIQNYQGNTARDECDADEDRRCYILLGGDASELDSESESDESEVSDSHSSWDSDDS